MQQGQPVCAGACLFPSKVSHQDHEHLPVRVAATWRSESEGCCHIVPPLSNRRRPRLERILRGLRTDNGACGSKLGTNGNSSGFGVKGMGLGLSNGSGYGILQPNLGLHQSPPSEALHLHPGFQKSCGDET